MPYKTSWNFVLIAMKRDNHSNNHNHAHNYIFKNVYVRGSYKTFTSNVRFVNVERIFRRSVVRYINKPRYT